MVETNVHFPSDISLLLDCMRKSLQLTWRISDWHNIAGLRQSNYHLRQYKSLVRKIQKLKLSNSKDRDEKLKTLHQEYITAAESMLSKVNEIYKLVCETESESGLESKYRADIPYFITEAYHHIDLIRRRVLLGETIPHSEKIFSVFEPYTRWISKGKAGVPVELGLPVTVLKDHFGLIIDYEIMEHTSDVDVVLPLLKRAIEEYKNIRSCSFDKGFWSKDIISELRQQIQVVIRRKGNPTAENKKQLENKEYVKLLNHHSAVESTINGLEHSGLDKCPDKGIKGFKRYVGLAILSRNLQLIGKKLREDEIKRQTDKRYKQAS